jgi:hypothetical protein
VICRDGNEKITRAIENGILLLAGDGGILQHLDGLFNAYLLFFVSGQRGHHPPPHPAGPCWKALPRLARHSGKQLTAWGPIGTLTPISHRTPAILLLFYFRTKVDYFGYTPETLVFYTRQESLDHNPKGPSPSGALDQRRNTVSTDIIAYDCLEAHWALGALLFTADNCLTESFAIF